MHTTATDGSASIEEMIAAAQARGLRYIAITDHSKRVAMANGLTPDRLLAQWSQIDEINRRGEGTFWVFKGIECDILEDGRMDLPDEVLAQADWVLASIQYGQEQSAQQITDRILGALRHPHVTAIAHPTGRLINRRRPYALDVDALFQGAVEFGKILELNANQARLDLHDEHCLRAKSLGIPIVINSDAHSPQGLDVLRFGVLQARRGGLTAADVLNSLPLAELKVRLGIGARSG
jgi:DNA polymerase (family 10)